jgi:para-aminobenzoate synthetase component 1
MHPLVQEISCWESPESLACRLHREPGLIFLRSSLFGSPQARYSFLAVRPFLRFRSYGSRCELSSASQTHIQFGNPWRILSDLISRYELLDEVDLPFPLGGCFGYWGYDLKHFVEPKLGRHAVNDLDLPDCQVGFYDSLLVFDHRLAKTWIVSVGLSEDGSQREDRAQRQADWWQQRLSSACPEKQSGPESFNFRRITGPSASSYSFAETGALVQGLFPASTLTRMEFIRRVERARGYIKAGDIYQVNLSHRLSAEQKCSSWEFFQRLTAVSPAPFSAFLDCGTFQIVSSSPELFLRLSGRQVQTRPIKGTRARSTDPNRDAQLAYELQTSAKETAELVMITDLLRNDLGRCCEFGSVHTPDLLRLERFPQVQHLVSTVEGRLRTGSTHMEALAACFPGGSVTGAPKFRAMEIIEELEPTARGPYTGALGYLGFNRESQLSIVIRAAICKDGLVHFPVGAGIVADSNAPEEYEETLAKARGFLEVLQLSSGGGHPRPDKASSAERNG